MQTDISKMIAELTLEEKASLLGGGDFWHTKAVERLGIPAFMMTDGPHGVRKQVEKADNLGINESVQTVCFPAACATASSFDPSLIHSMGEAIGNECQAENVSIILGPAVNIKRSPLCGRNFEYFSEDPYLAGKMAAAYISGVQSRHVGTSIKHFAANNQETNRMNVSAEVDERTLREIYLPAFEIAVKESQPKTVMCSYNKINGIYSADNTWLLTDVLRKDWGFEGFVMTDWGAVDDRVQGVRAGLELEMPGDTAYHNQEIVDAVRNGTLSEDEVNRAAERLLKVLYDYYDNRQSDAVFDRDQDHRIAVEIEKECAVLLQNNGILPLKQDAKIVYIGEFAKTPRYQGGGSSHINSSKVSSALSTALEKGRNVTYVKGFPSDQNILDSAELERAVEEARNADVAVIFAGLPESYESESYDRNDMLLPACQDVLIQAVTDAQPNTVVILHNGSPVEVPWADKAAAVLEMYLGGQGVGEAADALLFGEANPCGHLAETFPIHLEDNPSYLNFPGDGNTVYYAEGVFVGYRYYEKKKMPVRWAFGHGLSYTTFEIGNARVDRKEFDDDSNVTVSVDVKNTGTFPGKTVVQLYVSDQNGTPIRPVKELKGFFKVALEPQEMKTVSFNVDARALSYYNTDLSDWFAPSGDYALLLGDASDHITDSVTVHFSTRKMLPLHIEGSTTVGQLLSDPRTAETMNGIIKSFSSLGGVFAYSEGSEDGRSGEDEMKHAILMYLPLKALPGFTGVTGDQLQDILDKLRAAAVTENRSFSR